MPGFAMEASAPNYASMPWLHRFGQQMASALQRDQLAHAWLLQGAAGIGKRALAEYLAQLLLCAEPHDGQPCGHCRSCQLIAAGTHPDRLELVPEESGKPIKIDAVRGRIAQLQLTPQVAKRKVVIIDPAEAMNANAANALLKTLEEPPGNATLLLISHAPGRLLATIRSRCQKLNIPTPGRAEAMAWLTRASSASSEQIAAALLQSSGLPLLAWNSLEQPESGMPPEQLSADLIEVFHGANVSELAGRWSSYPAQELLSLWQRSLEQEILRRQTNNIVAFPEIPVRSLFAMHEVLGKAQGWIQVPLQQALLWEDLFTRWQRMKPRAA